MEEVTDATGIQFVSADWQPCGHKEVVICHGESHYDVHFYYVPEAEMQGLPDCAIGTTTNPTLPVCRDSTTSEENHHYFDLIDDAIPTGMTVSRKDGGTEQKSLSFCVDATSAILRSGVHYGDRSETNQEWRRPVTIMGSHACKLTFFEAMFSW